MTSLDKKALVSVFVLTAVVALLILVPAGSFDYWQGWLYLAVFFLVSILSTLYLMRNDPALLERRMRGGPTAEVRPSQKIIMLFLSIGFIALIVLPAFDHRFGWSRPPSIVPIVGNLLVVTGFYLIALVYRENTFTAATIQIAENQTVVSTGPYAIVRHPMYASALLYLFGTPLALGSYWGLIVFWAIIPFLVWRILDEEKVLANELPGYTEYQGRVRYRLLPLIW